MSHLELKAFIFVGQGTGSGRGSVRGSGRGTGRGSGRGGRSTRSTRSNPDNDIEVLGSSGGK